MENKYKIVFRGDIAPGHDMADVRARVQEFFRLDDEATGKLFAGRPVVIKKDLDENTARKWEQILSKIGARAELIAEEPETGQTQAPPAEEPYAMEVFPVGSDVLKPSERRAEIVREIATSSLSLDEVGADVLREDERAEAIELDLDVSHLELEKPAAE